MRSSSLIFFVIFAVWAAYMLQHWVRRREDLATARTVDRFSEAMRMLERRTPVKAQAVRRDEEPKPTLLRPQVSVKGVKPTAGTGSTAAAAPVARAAETTKRMGGLSLSSPEVKAGALLGALVLFVLSVVLAPFGVVPAWTPLLGLAAVGGVVVWLRRSAIASRQARRVAPAARPVRAPRAAGADENKSVAAAPVAKAPSAPATKRSPLVAEQVEHEEAVEVVETETHTDAVAKAEAEVFDARRWAPVDVPRPTYTMKAKAEREEVVPASTVDETDTRPLAARYENAPVDEIPFDGMALDEDYDELPEVYKAG
ncbi:hypothetical protein AA983_10605 [Dermacoccus sp. PE3]|uniref:hypothetical protein n=1 Tax=Dermacoccus sp. PE3 TaxID=1641401 RepID=UPI0006419510|nr:hypothetical protein [Dermacoccus sp. PE3]KLO62090.1 hypothetical protein AA983_10605 [Dermacoccus sp. PE3]